MKMKLRYLAMPIILGMGSASFAANDGTLGSTSTGDTDVTITIGDVVQVSVEGDIGLTYTPGSNSTGVTSVCVYRNSDNDVDVTLTSANPDGGNNFRMSDGGTNFLPYTVDFSGTTTALTDVTSGTANTISDEDNTSSNCGGTPYSHDLDVTVLSTDLDAAPSASYSDTITILAQPI